MVAIAADPGARSVAGVFACVTCALCLYSSWCHLKNYRRPDLQRLILRIIWMPAMYGVTAWLSLVESSAESAGDTDADNSDSLRAGMWTAAVLDPFRDFYEAFVLWIFFQLLVTYLGGEDDLMASMDDGRLPVPHTFPVNCCAPPIDLSRHADFLWLKRGLLQFVAVKPAVAMLTFVCRLAGVYQTGEISAASAYFYLALISNVSVCLSLYCLALLYLATCHDLAPFKPWPKFLCVKAVLFLSFWQGFGIALLAKMDVISAADGTSLQHLLISVEMAIAAMAHLWAFSHAPFAVMLSGRMALKSALKDAAGFNDLLLEVKHTWRGTNFRSVFTLASGRHNYDTVSAGDVDDDDHSHPHTDTASTQRSPLLHSPPRSGRDVESGGGSSSRFVSQTAMNALHFDDIDPNAPIERLYADARTLQDGDYGYDVR